jgi:oxaloacetate decarboxylase (Na+ extruding) subunit alpha
VPRLVDTTIRLLSQEPLAGTLPTAEILRVAEILDKAGFACLEISGGGVFDATVRRRAETPWERIRAIKTRVSTPLGIALRGRFLVGSQPVSGDIVGRFVSCAAENGIEVFRLHDPLNDVSNLREAGAAITNAGGAFHAGLIYSPGRTGETDTLVEQARKLPDLGATRVIVNDPTGALFPHRAQELVARIKEASALPVGFYVQGSAGTGLASALAAVEAGADLVATTVYPLALILHRVSGESLAESLQGFGQATGLETDRLWEAADVIDEHIGDEPISPVAPRIAVRAAEYDLPSGLVAALDVHLRAHAAGDRLEEVLEEVGKVRSEAGWPPLAAPIGQILASQALLHVLEARRYGSVIDEFRALVQGAYGETPEPVDPTVGRAVELLAPRAVLDDEPLTAEDVREAAEGLAASEEELVLIAMFGSDAEELLRTIRARHSRGTVLLAEDADAERGERIRELVKIVQESGVGEIEIEDEGMRVSVRRADEPLLAGAAAATATAETEAASVDGAAAGDGITRVESPMVGVFYRAPNPGAPAFVDVGDTVVPGQTLCLLEAMKLFNELKAEVAGKVRSIHIENAQPVEFGQLLFEIEPVLAPPAV